MRKCEFTSYFFSCILSSRTSRLIFRLGLYKFTSALIKNIVIEPMLSQAHIPPTLAYPLQTIFHWYRVEARVGHYKLCSRWALLTRNGHYYFTLGGRVWSASVLRYQYVGIAMRKSHNAKPHREQSVLQWNKGFRLVFFRWKNRKLLIHFLNLFFYIS